jgi:DinB superfamily
MQSIRPVFATWRHYNARLRDVVGGLDRDILAVRPGPGRWPLWATIGHLACQRVFWLCDFAGQPGAETTPFTNAAFDCPGDDDLEHVLSADDLAGALDSTFAIVDACLDGWAVDTLDDVIRHPDWDGSWTHRRGWVIERVFSHDVYHCAEINEALGVAGLAQVDLWN